MQTFKVDKNIFWYDLDETENYFTIEDHSADAPKFGLRYFVAFRTRGQTKGTKVFVKLFRGVGDCVTLKFNDIQITIWSSETVMFHFTGDEWERIL